MRGQAGNEYLYTFMIALIVIFLVGYSLWSMGILNECSFQKRGSRDPESFLIRDFRFSGSDSATPNEFTFSFLVRARDTVNVTFLRVLSGGVMCNETDLASEWLNYGEKFFVNGTFTNCLRKTGECLTLDVQIKYQTRSGFEHTETGSIITRAE